MKTKKMTILLQKKGGKPPFFSRFFYLDLINIKNNNYENTNYL